MLYANKRFANCVTIKEPKCSTSQPRSFVVLADRSKLYGYNKQIPDNTSIQLICNN